MLVLVLGLGMVCFQILIDMILKMSLELGNGWISNFG